MGLTVCYVLSVLRMTFSFHGTNRQNQAQRLFTNSLPGGGTSWMSDNYSV